jgi:hypothetical protein
MSDDYQLAAISSFDNATMLLDTLSTRLELEKPSGIVVDPPRDYDHGSLGL